MQRLTPHDIIIQVMNKLKERFEAIKGKNNLYTRLVMDADSLRATADERKAIADELSSIVAGIENLFQKQDSLLTNAMRNQLFRLEVQAKLAYLNRAYFDNIQHKAIFQTEPYLTMMVALFTRFLKAKSWFNCHLDEQCQRDLFALYSFLSTTQQNQVSLCEILITLKDKCDSNFIKVMTLFFLMVETISLGGKKPLASSIPMRQQLAPYEREFEQTFSAYHAHHKNLGEAASLRDQLELAVAHFSAYRYLFICFDANTRRKMESHIFFKRTGGGLNGLVKVYLRIGPEQNSKEILKFAKKESELRATHLAPALKLFPSERYGEIYLDRHLVLLTWFLLRDGLHHLTEWRNMVINISKQATADKFTANDKNFLTKYTEGLTSDIGTWDAKFSSVVAYTAKDLTERADNNPDELEKTDNFVSKHKKTKNEIEKKTDEAKKVVQQEHGEFEALEKAAEKICKEVLAWKEARNGSNASNQKKHEAERVADQAAQQGSPYIPPTQEGLEKEDEEEKPLAVSSAPVKSEGLRRLELCDSKLSHLITRLTKSTQFISSILKSKIVDKKRIPFETMDRLKTKLNSTLSDFDALKNMRQHFSRLVSSLPQEELHELNECITQSLTYAKEKEADFEKLLAQASEILSSKKRKQKVKKKGLNAPPRKVKTSPERRYELGYDEFVKQERVNTKKELSDEALEDKYLKNCQVVYSQALETITKKSSTPETASTLPIYVSYPERIQEKWKLIREIPGDHFLFGNALIDLLRGYSPASNFGLPSIIDFTLTCRTIGEVLEIQNPYRFHVSKYNVKQARLNLSNYETINVFLTDVAFFTCDGVVADESGLAQELITGALKDIQEGTLRTVQDAGLTLREHPQAVLTAVFRMSKGFVPDAALYKALFDWQPSDDLKIDYVKVIVAEHLKQLAPDDREEYVSNWNLLGLSKKIFKKDMTLRGLERLVLPAAPLLSFFTAKQEAPQAAVGASAERKVVLG
jgi:hypothetical protein